MSCPEWVSAINLWTHFASPARQAQYTNLNDVLLVLRAVREGKANVIEFHFEKCLPRGEALSLLRQEVQLYLGLQLHQLH